MVGLWRDPQLNSMWEQLELVSLTWVYCICHYSLGENRWPIDSLLASAKSQPPKLLNASEVIRTQSQWATTGLSY
jgi:hypothetical protein